VSFRLGGGGGGLAFFNCTNAALTPTMLENSRVVAGTPQGDRRIESCSRQCCWTCRWSRENSLVIATKGTTAQEQRKGRGGQADEERSAERTSEAKRNREQEQRRNGRCVSEKELRKKCETTSLIVLASARQRARLPSNARGYLATREAASNEAELPQQPPLSHATTTVLQRHHCCAAKATVLMQRIKD
jgi:hypothetical protein